MQSFWRAYRSHLTLLSVLIIAVLSFGTQAVQGYSQQPADEILISGLLIDEQGQPVPAAEIFVEVASTEEHIAQTESQEDGSWALALKELPSADSEIVIERHHYEGVRQPLDSTSIERMAETGSLTLGTITLTRRVTIGFWLAGIIFVVVLALIALEKLHSTTAALAGLSAVFVATFIGQAFAPDWYILDFERALTYINWEVIFLVMAMMIIIAIIEHTGIFQWTAFQAYKLSGGRAWVLVLILMLITAVASALLDNFTTMLLMTPISIQIAIAMGINPLALIIPEVMASNVGGISTLIGTPTNILIGAHAGIGFSDFLVNQTVGVLFALLAMGGYVVWHYRDEWKKQSGGISEALYQRLERNAEIEDPASLWKSGLVFVLVLVGFIIGERFHVVPAVPALIGATILLIWLQPNITQMIKAVDWTTLVFFMALFMIVGAVQEVGLISLGAVQVANLVGHSLPLTVLVIVFGAGTLSVIIANIPLAASLLPVVDFLSGQVPGATNKILYYALSMGAAMGGNGLLISGEANLVTAGITAQADAPISFKEFLKIGLPVTYITLLIGFLWLAIRFSIFAQ